MVNKHFEIIPAMILISIVLTGCSNNSEPEVAKSSVNQASAALNSNTNQTPAVLNSSNVSVNSPIAATPVAINTPAPTVDQNKKSSPPVKEPTPQIGSGGGDMFLFTQVRSALSSDKELFNAVIVEIKEGNATLTGKVSSEAQKAKAVQLIQSVQGIKTVKNNLRVSS